MKRVLFAAGLLAAVTGLHAQTINVRASIPFEFRVGPTVMPAGDYMLQSRSNHMWLRQEKGGNKSVMFLTNADTRPSAHTDSVLVFNRYGEGYFLAKVWSKYSPQGRVLSPTKLEKELARGRPAEAAMIAMRPR